MKYFQMTLRILAVALLYCLFNPLTQAATSLPVVQPSGDCSALTQQDFSAQVGAGVRIASARSENSPKGSYCKVAATISPDIRVQIALPASHWTLRFLQIV